MAVAMLIHETPGNRGAASLANGRAPASYKRCQVWVGAVTSSEAEIAMFAFKGGSLCRCPTPPRHARFGALFQTVENRPADRLCKFVGDSTFGVHMLHFMLKDSLIHAFIFSDFLGYNNFRGNIDVDLDAFVPHAKRFILRHLGKIQLDI